jgi:hypothetical protein
MTLNLCSVILNLRPICLLYSMWWQEGMKVKLCVFSTNGGKWSDPHSGDLDRITNMLCRIGTVNTEKQLVITKFWERLRWSRGSVLAFGTQVRGFKPGRSLRIFRAKNILSTPSFGGELKPSVPCRALRHVKEPKSDVEVVTFGKISRPFLAHSSIFRCWVP